MSTWQPIETSPRNSDDFLAYSDATGKYGVAYWVVYFTQEPTLVCNDSLGEWFNPTHWMPLPEPPEGKSA